MRIHITLAPMDRELPSLMEVRARRELPARLEEWIECELFADGDQLWLEVDQPDDALPLIEQVLAELSLEGSATVEVE